MPKFPGLPEKLKESSKKTWVTKQPMLPEQDRAVRPEELCVGAAVWLRQRFPNEEDITCVRPGHCTEFTLNEAGYMHPMVVLKFWQRPRSELPGDLMVAVSEMTGFRDNTTLESFNKRRASLIKFAQAIPILHKNESKFGETEQLSLETGWMQKKSWIRLQHVLLVPISYFWKYDWHRGGHAYDQRLSKPSYQRLMYLFSMEEDEYESTFSVVKNGKSRLARLASQGNLQNTQSQPFGIPQSTTAMFRNQQFGENKQNQVNGALSKYKYFHGSYVAQQDSTTQRQRESDRNSDLNKSSTSYSAPSNLSRTYSPTIAYLPSGQVNTPAPHPLGGSDTVMASNQYPGHMPQYRTPQMAQPGNFYPRAAPPNSQSTPTIQNNNYNNYYSNYFNAPTNHNFSMMPGQQMAPDYQQLTQQWQRSLPQQQQALNQYIGHMQPSHGQQIAHPQGPYNQMANPYNPNPHMQQYTDQHPRNASMHMQPQPQNWNHGHHRSSHASFSANSAMSNFPNMRNRPSITNQQDSMEGPIVSNGYASLARQQVSSPDGVVLYHRPQVEDYEESEAGNAVVQGDDMLQS